MWQDGGRAGSLRLRRRLRRCPTGGLAVLRLHGAGGCSRTGDPGAKLAKHALRSLGRACTHRRETMMLSKIRTALVATAFTAAAVSAGGWFAPAQAGISFNFLD